MNDTKYKYWAFISYSHKDKKWGDWLHKALETYKIPKRIVAAHAGEREISKRLFPVFRDREELPTATDLSENINKALADSRYLIVICSPNSAKSQYVNEEIKTFKALGRENKILSVIVDGEPNALDKPELGLKECFPEAIKFRVTRDKQITPERTEPIAADARKGKDGKQNALLKLVAGVLRIDYAGLKDREQERKRRNQIITSIVMASLMLVFAGLAWVAVIARNEAYRQKGEAVRQRNMAMEAIERLTYDVPDRLGKLPGSILIITDILEKNIQLLDRIDQGDTRDATGKSQRHRAANQTKIADRWLLIGNTQRALEAFGKAEIIVRELNAARHSVESRRDVALLDSRIGAAQRRKGNMEEAEKRHRAALENDRQLLREHPDEPEIFRAMAADWQELGDDLCAQVKHADALNAYTQFLLAAERLAHKYGSDKDLIYLATACDKLALIHAQLGSLTIALVYAGRCVALSQRLALDPLDVPRRRDLVMAWQRLGDLYRQNGDNDNAGKAFQSMAQIAEELAADPTNLDARRNAAIARRELGRVFLETKQPDKALEMFNQGLTRFESVPRDPDDRTAAFQMGGIYELRATALVALNRTDEAVADLLEMVRLLTKLPYGADKVTKNSVIRAHGRLAELYRTLDRQNDRQRHWQEALKLFNEQFGGSVLPQDVVNDAGNFYWVIGEQEAAKSAYRDDLAAKRKAALAAPTQESLRAWNMVAANLANLLAQTGLKNEASDILQELAASATTFLANHPNPVIEGDLSYSLLKQGELLRDSGRIDEAIDVLDQAAKHFDTVAIGRRNQFNIAFGLATIYRTYARVLTVRINQSNNHTPTNTNKLQEEALDKYVRNALNLYKELLSLDGGLLKTGKAPGISTDVLLQDVTAIADLSARIGDKNAAVKAWKHAADLAFTIYGTSDSLAARELLQQETVRAASGLMDAGESVAAQGTLDPLLGVFHRAAADPTDLVAHLLLSRLLSSQSWLLLLAGKPEKALKNGKEAIALFYNDKPSPAKLNLAHALLMNNRFNRAKVIYTKYAGTSFDDDRKWNDEVRNDFKLLRKAGIVNLYMDKIELLLAVDSSSRNEQ